MISGSPGMLLVTLKNSVNLSLTSKIRHFSLEIKKQMMIVMKNQIVGGTIIQELVYKMLRKIP